MSKTTLAFEIGTEELPAFDLHAATEQLPSLVANALGSVRVPFDDVKVYSSPRRLVAIVEGVPERTEASVEEFRGPAVRIAFDAEGNPTKAAAGFARGKGVDVADLERRDEDGVEYVYAVKNTSSADVAELLPETLKGVIEGISWPKSCRWARRVSISPVLSAGSSPCWAIRSFPYVSQGSRPAIKPADIASWLPVRIRSSMPTA